MSEPFRDPQLVCPACKTTPLRVFGQRLVCDKCTGLLLTDAELAQALVEVGGDPPIVTATGPSQRICPRCLQTMQACTVKSKFDLSYPFAHCDKDGMWLDGGVLEKVFEELGHKTHVQHSRHWSGVAGTGAVGYGMVGMSVALQSVANAFGGNQVGILWYERRPRPLEHTPFKTTLASAKCPVCTDALHLQYNLWGCNAGHGVFVETSALEAMISDMANAPWTMPAVAGEPGARACPTCDKPLVVEKLEGVTVDHCTTHGTWFDPTELESVLAHAAPKPTGLRGWLRRLFH